MTPLSDRGVTPARWALISGTAKKFVSALTTSSAVIIVCRLTRQRSFGSEYTAEALAALVEAGKNVIVA
jgi:hypothetical protein